MKKILIFCMLTLMIIIMGCKSSTSDDTSDMDNIIAAKTC